MVKTKKLLHATIAQIFILREQWIKITAIAASFNVSHSCIVETLQRIKEIGNFKSKTRSGRPSVTTPRADNRIHIYAKAHPFATAEEICSEVFHTGSAPSLHTIRRCLNKKFQLPSRAAAKKPKLSPKNIWDRIAFCRQYGGWTAAQWEDVIFSDESSIEQFANHSRNVRRPPGKRYDPKFVLPTVKNCPKVMIWGAITAHKRCGLCQAIPLSMAPFTSKYWKKNSNYSWTLQIHLNFNMTGPLVIGPRRSVIGWAAMG